MPRNIFLIFLAFGVVIAGGPSFYYASCWSQVMDGRSWPTTQAVINRIEADGPAPERSESSHTVYPLLAYTYRVGGRTLYGSRIWLSGNQFYNHREDAEAFVQQYAIGQSVPVSYNPQDPADSALLIENPPWQILLGSMFGVLWIGLSLFFRLTQDDDEPTSRFGKGAKAGTAHADGAADAQPPRVNALQTRGGCIIFALLFGGMFAIAFGLLFSVM